MATRARIALELDNGSFISSYQHWDGYPGGLGYNLIDNWCDPEKVKAGIEQGDASKWGYIVGEKIDFDDRSNPMHDVQNCYYGRDRGEHNVGPKTHATITDLLENGFNAGEEFLYIAREGKKNYAGKMELEWFYVDRYTDETAVKPLFKKAIQDHIDMLQHYVKETA